MSSNRLDVLIFGATGFTGNFIIEALLKISTTGDRTITFGIAGRSEKKLKETLENVRSRSTVTIPINISIVIADVKNDHSLRKMAKMTKIVINACGPYWLLGEPVVKACIAEGTHHIDLCAEPHFTEMIALKYHEAAKKKGVYIVNSCGLDSIPSEIGVLYLEANFPGTLNSIEIYEGGVFPKTENRGPIANIGTFESSIHLLANVLKARSIHSQLYPTDLPKCEPKLKTKLLPHRMPYVDGISILIPSPDLCSLYRSQRYFYEYKNKRPIQINFYGVCESWWMLFLFLLFTPIIFLFSQFECGRKILLKYPGFFTYGIFSNEQPSLETVEQTECIITLFGEGWKQTISELKHSSPVDKKIIGQVRCKSAGYGATAMFIALCAKVILTENDKLPLEGGAFSPAAAFADTSLLNQLRDSNTLKFNLICN